MYKVIILAAPYFLTLLLNYRVESFLLSPSFPPATPSSPPLHPNIPHPALKSSSPNIFWDREQVPQKGNYQK